MYEAYVRDKLADCISPSNYRLGLVYYVQPEWNKHSRMCSRQTHQKYLVSTEITKGLTQLIDSCRSCLATALDFCSKPKSLLGKEDQRLQDSRIGTGSDLARQAGLAGDGMVHVGMGYSATRTYMQDAIFMR